MTGGIKEGKISKGGTGTAPAAERPVKPSGSCYDFKISNAEEFNRLVEIRNAFWEARFSAMKEGCDVKYDENGKLVKFKLAP